MSQYIQQGRVEKGRIGDVHKFISSYKFGDVGGKRGTFLKK